MVFGTTRPNPAQWIGYAFGRALPASMRDWVANDLTGRNRVLRHLLRSLAPFLPIFAAFVVLLPGALWLRGATVLLGVLLALFYSAAYMNQNRAKRLQQHGLPADLENEARRARHTAERAAYLATHRG
ncbi:DUF5313 domain-containing protein [Aldersonia sp. NBC_00410]|uniref:DUF5313 family protein n=1 Tax=Aldersonia sp. NBC_00410 TaxID=2975954 RepID=UPI0022563204|nr:DUF5313 family protein [Aldersonia sp. NBC_00410]MCX5043182.1 DUF5313 domain-containing protein [Aldersonia sp. NBC_00410]